jgi:hypothetical protein
MTFHWTRFLWLVAMLQKANFKERGRLGTQKEVIIVLFSMGIILIN